jgi:pimeloyl-ACP methyl ester carboxylesterase
MTIRDHEVRLADGRILRTQDSGAADGQPVLLFHDGLGSRLVADPLAAVATHAGLRLLSHDRPGFGGSTAQPGRRVADAAADVTAIADRLGVDRFAVWGTSGGGPFALACAALLPDRVVAAALVSPLAPPDAPGLDWSAGMAEQVAQLHRLAAAGPDGLQPAMGQLAETLTATSLAGFVELVSPTLPHPTGRSSPPTQEPICSPTCARRSPPDPRARSRTSWRWSPRGGRPLRDRADRRARAGPSVVRRTGHRHPAGPCPLARQRDPRCLAAPVPGRRTPVAHPWALPRGGRLARRAPASEPVNRPPATASPPRSRLPRMRRSARSRSATVSSGLTFGAVRWAKPDPAMAVFCQQ